MIVNTINNSSTRGPRYTNFSAISTDVAIGQSYPITIINGRHSNTDTMACWVDWNYDGDFNDANETIAINYSGTNGSIGTGTGTITIPANATIGLNRLRLRIQYGTDAQPCGESGYGEVEDYSLRVSAALSTTEFSDNKFALYPNPNNGNFTITSSTNIYSIEVFNTIGCNIYSEKTNTNNAEHTISLNHLSAGVYFLKLNNDSNAYHKLIIE